ncbi:HK97 family phage prohead protease [Streptacidiphilus sp. N1-12]|uniref:HK97 family phage prohead protease n=2 Tax=Streptacidiphilus alkalitolerans TaxID=3342712 RepID=A0ABV6WEL7_9ACTN
MDLSARAARPTEIQKRQMPFRDVQLRAAPNGTGKDMLTFTGYACVTEVGYEMQDWLGPYTEVVRGGAFAKTLSEGADVPFLLNHSGMTLARTKSGTMELSEDTTGLHVEAQLSAANSIVRDIQDAMAREDLDEMSFAFWVTRQQWSPDWDQRDILEVNLNKGDVSLVNFGANPNTAGSQLNSRDLAAHLDRLPPEERREVFDRLAAEFNRPPVDLTSPAQARAWAKERFAELRDGAQLSDATMASLQDVLDLVAAADTAVDEAQVVLSDLMDVPNPDDPQENGADLGLYRARAQLLAL